MLDWIQKKDVRLACKATCMCIEDLCLAMSYDVAEPQKRGARFTINLNKATNYATKLTEPTA